MNFSGSKKFLRRSAAQIQICISSVEADIMKNDSHMICPLFYSLIWSNSKMFYNM